MWKWLLFAQTYEEHMARGRRLEILGWSLGVLSFLILGFGVYWQIRSDRKKKEKEAEQKSRSQRSRDQSQRPRKKRPRPPRD